MHLLENFHGKTSKQMSDDKKRLDLRNRMKPVTADLFQKGRFYAGKAKRGYAKARH